MMGITKASDVLTLEQSRMSRDNPAPETSGLRLAGTVPV